jgi:hypothetical protein
VRRRGDVHGDGRRLVALDLGMECLVGSGDELGVELMVGENQALVVAQIGVAQVVEEF